MQNKIETVLLDLKCAKKNKKIENLNMEKNVENANVKNVLVNTKSKSGATGGGSSRSTVYYSSDNTNFSNMYVTNFKAKNANIDRIDAGIVNAANVNANDVTADNVYVNKKLHVDSLDLKELNADNATFGDMTVNGKARFNDIAMFGDYQKGMTGGFIDKNGNAELNALTLREALTVPELRYKRQEIIAGYNWHSFGGGMIESVKPDPYDAPSGVITLKLDDGYGQRGMIEENDKCLCVFHDVDMISLETDLNKNWLYDYDDSAKNNIELKYYFAVSWKQASQVQDWENELVWKNEIPKFDLDPNLYKANDKLYCKIAVTYKDMYGMPKVTYNKYYYVADRNAPDGQIRQIAKIVPLFAAGIDIDNVGPVYSGLPELSVNEKLFVKFKVIYEMTEDDWDAADEDGHNGNFKFKGFRTSYFKVVNVLNAEHSKFEYVLRPVDDKDFTNNYHPNAGASFVCYANDDANYIDTRRNCKYVTPTYEVRLQNMTDWTYGMANVVSVEGDLNGFTVKDDNGGDKPLTGTGVLIGNAYIYGNIDTDVKMPRMIEITLKDGYQAEIAESNSTRLKVRLMRGFENISELAKDKLPVISGGQNIGDYNIAKWDDKDKCWYIGVLFENLVADEIYSVFTVTFEDEKANKYSGTITLKKIIDTDTNDYIVKIESWFKVFAKDVIPVLPDLNNNDWSRDFASESQKISPTSPKLWRIDRTWFRKSAPKVVGPYIAVERGDDGAKGDKGDKGNDGTSLVGILNYYASNNDENNAPTTNWTLNVEEVVFNKDNKFLWNKEEIKYSDTSLDKFTTPIIVARYTVDGAQGDKGDTGASIIGFDEEFVLTQRGTTPAPNADWINDENFNGQISAEWPWLWNREKPIWNDEKLNASAVFGSPMLIAVYGDRGADGTSINVKPNASECKNVGDAYIDERGHLMILDKLVPRHFSDAGEIKGPAGDKAYVHIAYANFASDNTNTKPTEFSVSDPKGKEWVGTYADYVIEDADINNWKKYKWSKIKGEQGDKGDQGDKGETGPVGPQGPAGENGTSVKDVEDWYSANNDENNAPTANWTTTVPALSKDNKFLWNKEKTIYDGTAKPTWTKPRIISRWTKDGRGIVSIDEYFQVSESSKIAPMHGNINEIKANWEQAGKDAMPVPNIATPYLWNIEVVNYNMAPEQEIGTPHLIGTAGKDGAAARANLFAGTNFRKNFNIWYKAKNGVLQEDAGMFDTNSMRFVYTNDKSVNADADGKYIDMLKLPAMKNVIEPEKWYCASFWVKNTGTKDAHVNIHIWSGIGEIGYVVDINEKMYVDGKEQTTGGDALSEFNVKKGIGNWEMHWCSFKTSKKEIFDKVIAKYGAMFILRLINKTNSEPFEQVDVSAIKLEEGKTPTAWCLGEKDKTGAIYRNRGNWNSTTTYYCNDEVIDIVAYDTGGTQDYSISNTAIRWFKAVKTNINERPENKGEINVNWEKADYIKFVATDLLLGRKIFANEIDANGIKAENVDISGKLSAKIGNIGAFTINDTGLTNNDGKGQIVYNKGYDSLKNTGQMLKIGDNSDTRAGTLINIEHHETGWAMVIDGGEYGQNAVKRNSLNVMGACQLNATHPNAEIKIKGASYSHGRLEANALATPINAYEDFVELNGSGRNVRYKLECPGFIGDDGTMYGQFTCGCSAGKRFYLKNIGTEKLYLRGFFILKNKNVAEPNGYEYILTPGAQCILIYNGREWVEF